MSIPSFLASMKAASWACAPLAKRSPTPNVYLGQIFMILKFLADFDDGFDRAQGRIGKLIELSDYLVECNAMRDP